MATTISKISEKIIDDLYAVYPTLFDPTKRSLFLNAFQSAMTTTISTDIALSRVEPDYERIMLQLTQSLSENSDWRDIITAGTGHGIIRMIASGIAYDQYSIMRAYQEAYLNTASSNNSVFAITRMLGVRPQRKLPARCTVLFTRTNPGNYLEIPAYSQFTINGIDFYNREMIPFKDTSTQASGILYQGRVAVEEIESNGEPFQRYTVGNGSRSAANSDVVVIFKGTIWTRVTDGPWLINRNAYQYYESTAPNGDVEIEFGNGDYGYVPDVTQIITIKWVETLGKNGNIDVTGLVVTWKDIPTTLQVTGLTVTNVEGGNDELSAEVYKKIAPNLRAANRRAVRRSDYIDLALQFATVKDALFRGQAEVASGRRSMTNVVLATLLTDTPTPWLTAQFNSFIKEFQENLGTWRLEFIRVDPTSVIVNIKASLFCKSDASLSEVEGSVTDALTELFRPKKGHLGYNIYLSDISDILNGRILTAPNEKLERDIEYCILDPSMTDIILPDKTYYAKLGTVDLTLDYTTRGGFQGRLDLSPTGNAS